MSDRQPRVLTGDRPTGSLHLGHFVGSLKNRVALQDNHDLILVIADYHTLTTHPSREDVQATNSATRDIVLDYLSVGIDPDKATIYRQSDVPSVAELALLFGMLVTVPRLERVPTLKEVMRDKHIETPSFGLLGYPVLQSADILHVRADLVPVGKDQESHIEVTRHIARRFNTTFGDVFPEAKAMIGGGATLVGTDGQAKMSKSLGNAILLSDTPEAVAKKVMGMFTDPNRVRADIPGRVEGNPVFEYHAAFNADRDEVADLAQRYRAGRVGDVEVKRKLIRALEAFLAPIRGRRGRYAGDDHVVRDILASGRQRVAALSAETVQVAREAMGFREV
ncbi:MAG: tryptophan--tRNA ligase [Anaerolineae bacterium]